MNSFFKFNDRGTNLSQEIIGGLTTFLTMLYSIIVVPSLMSQAGFDKTSVFLATCLISAFGSILMGFWANLPIAIGSAISLTAFTSFSLILGQKVDIPTTLGMIFYMGILFTLFSITGIRIWVLKNIPGSLSTGIGIGIGMFLLLIAANSVNLVTVNTSGGLPVKIGSFSTLPSIISIIGLIFIIALEKLKIKGSILIVLIILTIIGLIFDPNVKFNGIVSIPQIGEHNQFFKLNFTSPLTITLIPIIFVLVITAIFDATGTIKAIASQANLNDKNDSIPNANKALTTDSLTSIVSGLFGTSPAAAYIESASGTAAGARTGFSSIIVGIGFLLCIFLSPLASIVPSYATAPALMYVGLLMLSNVTKLDFNDTVAAMSSLICAIFIVLTANIVNGIMLGFISLVIGRIVSLDFKNIKIGTVAIAVILFLFYLYGYNI